MKGYHEIVVFIEQWLRQQTASDLNKIDVYRSFADYGVDSGRYTHLASALSIVMEKTISPLLILQSRNIHSLIECIISNKPFPDFTQVQRQRLYHQHEPMSYFEPIAIIGMSCRFPRANHINEFWDMLMTQQSAISAPDDWHKRLFNWDKINEEQYAFFNAGYLENLDEFDHHFFDISRLNALNMDPQHRILLETSFHALEHAGITIEEINGQPVGVSVGIYSGDHALNQSSTEIEQQLGQLFALAANNISYFYNLTGPSIAIDTACSSGLHAILNACHYLHERSATMMLAGGVNLILNSEKTLAYAKANMLSPSGVCRPFDVNANGFVRGEGAGWVVLKRYEDAVRDGDKIISVIIGGAENQDGKTNHIATPNPTSQEQLIKLACARACVLPDEIAYLETHGTGTHLGDPIEAKAFEESLSNKRRANRPCYIGSVKANIGHLESAAGIASVIKASLCIYHQYIPGHPHFSALNPLIDFDSSLFKIHKQTLKWPEMNASTHNQYAAVSSFGIGGSNAHLILTSRLGMQLRDKAARASRVQSISGRLSDLQQDPPSIFLYPGVGGEWHQMGRELYLQEPVFRQIINDANDVLTTVCPNSLVEFIFNDSSTKYKEYPELLFPSIVSLQIGLSKLLAHRGIFPTAVIGHSLGECSAAHIAGLINFEHIITYAYQSGCFHIAYPTSHTLLIIEETKETMLSLITRYSGSIWIAGEYHQRSVLVCGTLKSIQDLMRLLMDHHIYFRKVRSVINAHYFVTEMPTFIERLEDRRLNPPQCHYYSCMEGGLISKNSLTLKQFLAFSLQPIEFLKTITSLIQQSKQQPLQILEINSHPIMSNSLLAIGQQLNIEIRTTHLLKKPPFLIKPTNVIQQQVDLPEVNTTSAHISQQQRDAFWLPFVFSAKSEQSLIDFMGSMKQFLNNETIDLLQLSHHLAVNRSVFHYKTSFICKTSATLKQAIDDFLANPVIHTPQQQSKKIAFIFAGQGNQWEGLGQDLYKTDLVFKTFVHECQSYLSLIAPELSIIKLFNGTLSIMQVHDNVILQVFLFVLQYALAIRMVAAGIQPDAICGHSMGEIAAVCFAGLIDLKTAIYMIYHRGLAVNLSDKKGAMLVVNLAADQLLKDISSYPEIWIAAENAPSWTVISGDASQITAFANDLTHRNIAHKLMDHTIAFHTPYMKKGGDYLHDQFSHLSYHEARLPIFSTVTGQILHKNDLHSSYWTSNLKNTVRFKQCITNMLDNNIEVFVEFGPHSILSASVREIAGARQQSIKMMSALIKGIPYHKTILDVILFFLHTGVPINWTPFYPKQQKMDVPLYCWSKETLLQNNFFTLNQLSSNDVFDVNNSAETPTPLAIAINTALQEEVVLDFQDDDELLEIVTNMWQDILTVKNLQVDVDLSIYQVNSLNIIQFITRIRAFLEIELTVAELLKFRTIRAVANYLNQKLLEMT